MDLFDLVAKLTLDTSEYDKGLGDAEKETNGLKDKWSEATTKISTGLKSIGAGAGILTALGAGAFKAADGVSKNLDNIDKMSQKLGLTTDAYQEWDYVMKISGTSIDNMAMGLKTLTNKFDDAVNGSDSARQTFERLGLSMEDIQGLSREDLFAEVIYAFQDMEDTAERAALANDLLGRSGQELAPLFNTSAEETKNLIQQVHDLGGVMSEDAVKQGAEFQDSLTSLKTAFSGAASTLMEKLIPTITTLMDKISNFVASGGLDTLIELFQEWAPVVAAVVAAIAGFKIVSGIITLVQGFSAAFGVLNTVMAANPIGLVIIAITGLIAAFVLLWNKSEAFREFWINTWDNIKEKFEAVANFIGNVFGIIADLGQKAWDNIKNTFSEVGEWFSNKWENMKNKVSEKWSAFKENASQAWEKTKEFFSPAADWFKDKFNKVKENVSDKLDNMKEKAALTWDLTKKVYEVADTWFKDKWSKVKENVSQKWDDVKKKSSDTWDKIKEAYSKSDTWLSDKFNSAKDKVKEKWDKTKDNFNTAWNNIKTVYNSSDTWFGDKFKEAKEKAANAWSNAKEVFGQIWTNVKNAFSIGDALSWGKDMIDNFVGGITSKIQAVRDAVSSVASTVKGIIGFSEPTDPRSPLHNFHTFAPDMMNLFIKGIEDNEKKLTDAVASAFDFENLITAPTMGASSNGTSAASVGGRGNNYYTINVNQPVSTPADMLREIRTEAQYGLMIGEALA